MNNLLSTKITFVPNVRNPAKFEEIPLSKALGQIKNGTYKELVENAQLDFLLGDDEGYKLKKNALPSFAFNGTFEGKVVNAHFKRSSSLIHFDLDKLSRDQMIANRKLFSNDPTMAFVFASPSGYGLKLAVHVDPNLITDDAAFKIAFAQIASFWAAKDIFFDMRCSDIRRVCFASYDEQLYHNSSPAVFPLDMSYSTSKKLSSSAPAVEYLDKYEYMPITVNDDLNGGILPDITLDNAESYLPPPGEQSYAEWWDVGAALHHQFKGSNEALELFDRWSQGVREYKGYADVAKQWAAFKRARGPVITFKSIIKAHSKLVASQNQSFEWETPSKIETKTPPVQALNPELIPDGFRSWLDDVSFRMQTPGDFAAIAIIVIVGSLIGAGCGMRPKRLDDWEIIPNVWGAAIGRPSVVLKTPSLKESMGLLERLQAVYGELFELNRAEKEFDSLANSAMVDDVKAKVKKCKGKDGGASDDEMIKLKADYLAIAQSTEPEAHQRLFKTNETSIQSMTVLQNQNPRGILVFRDELTGLLVKWDREDGADERAYFLEGWNGNGSYTDCKIGRGITDAKSICISLLGGIQPDKLKRYLYQAMQGNNDGLMQRLQLAVWPDEPESWQLVDTIPNKAEKQRAYSIMENVAELDFVQYDAVKGEYDDRPYFRFDEAGQAIFNEWLSELQIIKIKQEENPLMVEHFGKFRSLMPSLALIFHCIDIADGKARGNVSAQAAQLAVEWCTYLESHARRIYAMAESPEHEAAVRLSGKIKSKSLSSPFTAKDVYRKCWHGLNDRQEVDAACNILIEENWLMMKIKPRPTTGRPPLPEYYINTIFL